MQDEEFDDFFVARVQRLRRVAFAILHDWHLAEDAVQIAFVKVHQKWRRIRPETLEAYVRRAVVNTSISLTRRSGREVLTWQTPDVGVDSPDVAPDLLASLQSLPTAQRIVIALRYVDDLSVTEVARVLDISEGTVKSQSARGLAALRLRLPKVERDLR